MGFYPVLPGDTIYAIGIPLFEKCTLNLDNVKKFIIEAKNVSEKNFYIRSAELNGKPYSRSWISHNDIVKGGKYFQMGGGYSNTVSWKGPGIKKQVIPPDVLFHE